MEMDHISNQLTAAFATTAPVNYLNPLNKTLAITQEENTIIQLKYKSPRLAAIPAKDLQIVLKDLLLKIHVITGWVVPEATLQTMFFEQFKLKAVEAYADLNPDEILFAFRNNSTVKDWGKKMNLNLFDEVIMPYKNLRFDLSQMEERVKVNSDVNKKALPVSKVSDDEFIKSVRHIWEVKGRAWKVIPVLAYNALESVLNLTREQKLEYQAKVQEVSNAQGDELKTQCRQFAVHQYFLNNEQK